MARLLNAQLADNLGSIVDNDNDDNSNDIDDADADAEEGYSSNDGAEPRQGRPVSTSERASSPAAAAPARKADIDSGGRELGLEALKSLLESALR